MQSKQRGDVTMTRRVWDTSRSAAANADPQMADDDKADALPQMRYTCVGAGPEARDSSSVATFQAFLAWAHSTAPHIQSWCIVMLGHGGGVLDICPDEHASGTSWMSVTEVAEALSQWQPHVELLFLQNCCKSSVASLMPFSTLPKLHILAAQTILGTVSRFDHLLCRRP
jgi:hypothetical protein